jgi:hypothetical protein
LTPPSEAQLRKLIDGLSDEERRVMLHHGDEEPEAPSHQKLEALQAAVERLEGGKTFDPKIEPTDTLSAEAVSRDSAMAEVSRIFQDPTERSFAKSEDPPRNPLQVTDNLRDGIGLPAVAQLSVTLSEGWYRYGDSNPGPVAEKGK